jgi:hypothetical protein
LQYWETPNDLVMKWETKEGQTANRAGAVMKQDKTSHIRSRSSVRQRVEPINTRTVLEEMSALREHLVNL